MQGIVTFVHDGSFPDSSKDFYSVDKRYPCITLRTREDAREEEDGTAWLFRVLDVEMITEAVAREAIAEAIGLKGEEIELREDDLD